MDNKPRVSSRPSNWSKLYTLAEVAAGDYGGSSKSKSCKFFYQLKSTKPDHKHRVSVSSPPSKWWKLNMLADVAVGCSSYYSLVSRELTEGDDPIRVSSRLCPLEILGHVGSLLYQECGGAKENKLNTLDEAKSRITNCVNVPRKKRSLRHRSSSSTTRWVNCLIQPENPNPDADEEYAPSSSTCVTVSKKRRPIDVEMRSSKKRETVVRRRLDHVLPTQPTTVPEWLVNVMAREGNGYDPMLIIARELFQSDLDPQQARLSMPLKQVVSSDFLTEEETIIIYEQSVLKTRKEGVSVVLVDPLLNKHVVDLRKWQMNGGWNYVFVDGWNDVVAMNNSFKHNNNFKVGLVFPVWSFRSGEGKLCFALVPPN